MARQEEAQTSNRQNNPALAGSGTVAQCGPKLAGGRELSGVVRSCDGRVHELVLFIIAARFQQDGRAPGTASFRSSSTLLRRLSTSDLPLLGDSRTRQADAGLLSPEVAGAASDA